MKQRCYCCKTITGWLSFVCFILFYVIDSGCRKRSNIFSPTFFKETRAWSNKHYSIFNHFMISRKTKNMRAMLDLQLLNVCTALHAYFKETTGTGPTWQLVQHNRFKGHLVLYLCGSQAQRDSAFHLTWNIQPARTTTSCYFLVPLTFFVYGHGAQCSPCGSTGTATHDAGRDGLPDCNCTCKATNCVWWAFPPGET